MITLKPAQEFRFRERFTDLRGQSIAFDRDVEVSIFSPRGVEVSQGIAVPGNMFYYFDWVVPENAEPSTVSRPWKIQWKTIVRGEHYTATSPFEVEPIHSMLDFSRSFLMTENSQETIGFEVPLGAEDVRVEFMHPAGNYVIQNETDFQTTETATMVRYRSTIDVRNLTMGRPAGDNTTFPVKISYVHDGIPAVDVQIAEVVPMGYWIQAKGLRYYADKAQKRDDSVRHYFDEDYYEALKKGLEELNGYPPQVTGWTFATFPYQGMQHFLTVASARWLLRSQYIMAGELQIDFSGQTVTLNYDPTQYYDTEIGRLKDDLDKFSSTKANWLFSCGGRRSVLAVRINPVSYGHTYGRAIRNVTAQNYLAELAPGLNQYLDVRTAVGFNIGRGLSR